MAISRGNIIVFMTLYKNEFLFYAACNPAKCGPGQETKFYGLRRALNVKNLI